MVSYLRVSMDSMIPASIHPAWACVCDICLVNVGAYILTMLLELEISARERDAEEADYSRVIMSWPPLEIRGNWEFII